MKKTILFFVLSFALITGAVGTVSADEGIYPQYVDKKVDAKIFLNGIRNYKYMPSHLELSGSLADSIPDSNTVLNYYFIVAFIYKGNLYMRYEDFIDFVKPDRYEYFPIESKNPVSPSYLKISKYGREIMVEEGSNKLKIDNKITKKNIPIPFGGGFHSSGTMFIPVRAVAEGLGLKVEYLRSGEFSVVTIKENQAEDK